MQPQPSAALSLRLAVMGHQTFDLSMSFGWESFGHQARRHTAALFDGRGQPRHALRDWHVPYCLNKKRAFLGPTHAADAPSISPVRVRGGWFCRA